MCKSFLKSGYNDSISLQVNHPSGDVVRSSEFDHHLGTVGCCRTELRSLDCWVFLYPSCLRLTSASWSGWITRGSSNPSFLTPAACHSGRCSITASYFFVLRIERLLNRSTSRSVADGQRGGAGAGAAAPPAAAAAAAAARGGGGGGGTGAVRVAGPGPAAAAGGAAGGHLPASLAGSVRRAGRRAGPISPCRSRPPAAAPPPTHYIHQATNRPAVPSSMGAVKGIEWRARNTSSAQQKRHCEDVPSWPMMATHVCTQQTCMRVCSLYTAFCVATQAESRR